MKIVFSLTTNTAKAGFLCLMLLLCVCDIAFSQDYSGSKPSWVTKGEASLNSKRSNESYFFKAIQSEGQDLQVLKANGINVLSDYIGKRNQITGTAVTEMYNKSDGSSFESDETFRMVFGNDFETGVFYAILIDEYWEHLGGNYRYYALYAVSEDGNNPTFDRTEVSRNYGITPAFMSIIPGVGQLYKGSKTKGLCMLGGGVLGAAAIVYCESCRSAYVAKQLEQPKYAKTYKTRADNFAMGRNVAIAATGAIMVYSIVDAVVAPGATRIKVSKDESLNIRPTALVLPEGMGIGASLAFTF